MPATLTINGQTIDAAPGASLFDYAERLGVRIPTSCNKQGKCRECIVEVTEGEECLTPRGDRERHLKGAFRLSCRAEIVREGTIKCHTMRRGRMQIERSGDAVRSPAPGPRPPAPASYGLAADIGTTTVVLRLHDLATGVLLADAAFENPQRFGGSEIMSRIQYDTEHPGRLLFRTLAGYMAHAIEDFPVDPRAIREVVIVGNSTMRDLFFRQNVWPIGQSPYRSITELEVEQGKRTGTALETTGVRSLLPIDPQAHVYGAPIVSGHVGADAAACMLAIDLAHEERLVAIMDIGTNTELILGNRDRILAASCPAGPAFEGGTISCGMPALDGAIEDVAIDEGGAFRLGVIGGGAPEGICGSGLVDLLSELLRTGRMNALGRFENTQRIDLAPGVYFLESDVNELAQAKGANAAGLRVVAERYGVSFDDIEVFYLAGGFGRHLKIEAAQRIGLIPSMDPARIVQAGNAAIEGASIALRSPEKRRELEDLVRRVEHCRLETHPDFFDFFVDGCQFAPL
jgi:uncharacterized 2Fe-2S/4Fe-4S cluster protein (DUF4445 family)